MLTLIGYSFATGALAFVPVLYSSWSLRRAAPFALALTAVCLAGGFLFGGGALS